MNCSYCNQPLRENACADGNGLLYCSAVCCDRGVDRELIVLGLLATRMYARLKRIRARYTYLSVDSLIMTACDDMNLALRDRDKAALAAALLSAARAIALDMELGTRDLARNHGRAASTTP